MSRSAGKSGLTLQWLLNSYSALTLEELPVFAEMIKGCLVHIQLEHGPEGDAVLCVHQAPECFLPHFLICNKESTED